MGLPEQLPAITGLVLTSAKENELVEIPLVSPLPAGQVNPLLAHWTYGLGRSVAFTSDAGRRWTKAWADWPSYAAFWSQVIRWSMRPADRGNLTLNVRREEGRIKVVVDALDKNNQFLNFLRIQGNVVNPDLKSAPIELVQTAPGRYEATIENADASGNYFVNLGYRGPDNVQGVISTGVSIPYSDEYRELRCNPTTLDTIATPDRRPDRELEVLARRADRFAAHGRRRGPLPSRPGPGQSPIVRGPLADPALAGGLSVPGRRRRPAASPLDVDRIKQAAVKRVAEAPRPGRGDRQRLHGEAQEPQGGGRRAARPLPRRDRPRPELESTLFPTTTASGPIGEPLLEEAEQRDRPTADREPAAPGLATGPKEPEKQSYTNRLLKAKQRVWEEREKDNEKKP